MIKLKTFFLPFFVAFFLFSSVVFIFAQSFEYSFDDEEENASIGSEDSSDEKDELNDLDALLKGIDEEDSTRENVQSNSVSFNRFPHKFKNGVNDIALEKNTKSAFYVVGGDGYVAKIRFPSFETQTWQFSTLSIKKIASHPDGSTIALYETNGSSIHKISVWNWRRKEKIFVIRPNYVITSLNWSANGSYLLVGNMQNGMEVFSRKGHVVRIYSSMPGIITLSTTGKREKSIVTYGSNGKLIYTSIKDKKKLAEYKTLEGLENPQIFKNFTRIVGYRDGKVYLVNALTGKGIEEYNSKSAIFTINPDDEEATWIEKIGGKNSYVLHKGKNTYSSFSLANGNIIITSSLSFEDKLILGLSDGSVQVLEKGEKIALSCPFEYKVKDTKDIVSTEDALYLLKSDGVIVVKNGINEEKKVIKTKVDFDSIICATTKHKDDVTTDLILWNKDQKKNIYRYSLEKDKLTTLFKPKSGVLSCSAYKNFILVVESSGLISLINLEKGKAVFYETIEGSECAVQRSDEHIVIAKNSLSGTASPLFELNINTRESVPIRLKGDLAFSLTKSKELGNTLFCFLLNSDKDPVTTNLIKLTAEEKAVLNGTFEKLLTYEDEDFDCFIVESKGRILTNLGKDSIIHFNMYSKRLDYLERCYSLPKKAQILKDYIVSLNFDGSVTWYDKNTLAVVSLVDAP